MRPLPAQLAFAFLVTCAAPCAMAQPKAPSAPPDYWGPFVGNWKVEFLDKQGQPAGVGEFAFHPGPLEGYTGTSAGLVYEPSRPDWGKTYVCGGKRSGGAVELGCDTYGFATNFTYVTLSGDASTLRGWWSNEKDKRTGMVRFRRVPPVIESVEVLDDGGGVLDYANMKRVWSSQAKPHIRLRLRGREMPIWIELRAAAVVDASIDDPKYRIVRETWPSVNDRKQRWRQGYLDVVLAAEPDAKPGRKVLTLNGVRREFDLVFANYREEGPGKLKGLRYVELKDGKYVPISGELRHGATFFVEAAFDNKPAQSEYTVKLSWGPGPAADVRVKPSDDAKVFRSKPLQLQPPAANR